MRAVLLLLIPLLSGCLSGTSEAEPVQEGTATVYHGGTIWTGGEPQFVEAVAVDGERIIATGSLAELRPLAADFVDLDGRMLLPGFHDTHNHLLDWVLGDFQGSLFSDDPSAMSPTTFDPVQGTANQQVIGSIHVCHWGVQHAESAVDAAATVWAGNLARDGCYLGAAPGGEGQAVRLAEAERIAASFGLTSHVQAGWDAADLERLPANPSLRWNIYLWPESIGAAADAQWTTGSVVGDYRILGVKIYGDGWLGPRTAAMHGNYGDRPHNGFQFYEQSDLDAIVQEARDAGLKMTAHAIGDRAVDAVLTAYEQADESRCAAGPTCGDARPSIEHASVMTPGAVDRMVALGLVPSLQMSFPTSDAHWIDNALGEAAGDPYPWATMTRAGLALAGSSDWPIEALAPLWGVERAVTRQEVDDSLPQPYQPAEAVDLDTALRMITSHAAYLEFREGEVGSIAPGLLADFVVLDEDLFAIDASAIADVDVVATMVGGVWVHGSI